MERQHRNDRDRAVSQPVGHLDAKACQEAWRAADTLCLKHGQPCLGLAPAGDHVRDNDRQREKRLERQVGADHQPRQHRTEQDRADRNTEADQQRIEQRLDQQVVGQVGTQQALPVPKREIAGGTARLPRVALGERERGRDHIQQREHDQIGQQHDCDQHNHVIRIGDHGFDLILQPPGLGVIFILWFHRFRFPPSIYAHPEPLSVQAIRG